MPLRIRTALYLLVFLSAATDPAFSEKRVALVIGNAAYKHAAELANPKNDAADMAAALQRLKFTASLGLDLDKAALMAKVREFETALEGAELAILFYAGHGVEVARQNYLIPIDGRFGQESDIAAELISLQFISQLMQRRAKISIVFFNSNRNNPNSSRNNPPARRSSVRGDGAGFRKMESDNNALISFATQPGNVVVHDSRMRNSPYTDALLRHIETPGLDLPAIMSNVRKDVMAATKGKQVPWEHSSLQRAVYFKERPAGQQTEPAPGQVRP